MDCTFGTAWSGLHAKRAEEHRCWTRVPLPACSSARTRSFAACGARSWDLSEAGRPSPGRNARRSARPEPYVCGEAGDTPPASATALQPRASRRVHDVRDGLHGVAHPSERQLRQTVYVAFIDVPGAGELILGCADLVAPARRLRCSVGGRGGRWRAWGRVLQENKDSTQTVCEVGGATSRRHDT